MSLGHNTPVWDVQSKRQAQFLTSRKDFCFLVLTFNNLHQWTEPCCRQLVRRHSALSQPAFFVPPPWEGVSHETSPASSPNKRFSWHSEPVLLSTEKLWDFLWWEIKDLALIPGWLGWLSPSGVLLNSRGDEKECWAGFWWQGFSLFVKLRSNSEITKDLSLAGDLAKGVLSYSL